MAKKPENRQQTENPQPGSSKTLDGRLKNIESLSNEDLKSLVDDLLVRKSDLESRNKKLQKNLEALHTLIDSSMLNQVLLDTEGKIVIANETAAWSLKRKLDDMIARNVFKFFTTEVAQRRKDELKRVVSSGKAHRFEDERDGMLIRNDLMPLLDERGNVVQVAVNSIDITRQREAEKALKDSEERYRTLSDATFEAIFISRDGYCIDTNETATRMFGYTYDEFIGMFGTDVIAPESVNLVCRNMLSGYDKPYEALARRKDGSTFHVEIRGRMMTYKSCSVRVTVLRDIDGYKRAAASLQETRETMQALIDASNEREMLVASQGTILALNELARRSINSDKANLIGSNLYTLFPEEVAHKRKAYFQQLLETGRPVHFIDETGGRHLIHTLYPILDTGGKVSKIATSSMDITRQQEAEKALEESEEKYRQLFENALDAIMVFDAESRQFEDANPATLGMFGYTKAEFEHLRVEEISAEPNKTRRRITDTIDGPPGIIRVPLRYYLRKDGTIFPGELFAAKFHTRGRLKIIGSVRDITERQKQTEILQKREHELSGRVKELNCLYGISKLNEQPGLSSDAILQGTVDLVAGALQFPEIAMARIRFKDREYKTGNFTETPWRTIQEITVDRRYKGTLEIGYLEQRPETDRGPLLEDELRLLKAVSERVGKIIQRKQTRWQLKRSKEKLRYLASRLLTAQERERKRISMELHDDLGQRLTVLKLQIRSVIDRLGDNA